MTNANSRLRQSVSGPLVFLFGPLELSFDSVVFTQIRETVLTIEDHHWILDVITELPLCWQIVTNDLPNLHAGSGLKHLEHLKRAFLTESPLETDFPLSNTILIPLVVIFHLTQYAALLKSTTVELDERVDLFAAPKRDRETLGFCTGLLSAFAISSTDSQEDFCKFGAAAIRLGMLIGMVVDARDADSELGTSKSLSTAWSSVDKGEIMLRILNDFPEVRTPVSI